MYCQNCGSVSNQGARFCQSCGKQQALPQKPSSPIPSRVVQPRQKSKSKVLWWLIGGIVLMAIVIVLLDKSSRDSNTEDATLKTEPSTTTESGQSAQSIPPQIAPPTYRLYKSGTNQQTTYVVPLGTSDEQLKSLLWLFRVKVRTGDFKAIGITQPTTKQWGQHGYTSGMLVIYRGAKCANEGYISDAELEEGKLGACGYGDHDDAYYHWGVHGDPYKDEAAIATENGEYAQVFDYKDNWHEPSEGFQTVSETTKEAWKAKQQEWEPRQRFAVAMANKLNEQGIAIDVSTNETDPNEIDFNSKLFKDSVFQDSFFAKILPGIRPNLCNAGFHSIRVLQGNDSIGERIVRLQCH